MVFVTFSGCIFGACIKKLKKLGLRSQGHNDSVFRNPISQPPEYCAIEYKGSRHAREPESRQAKRDTAKANLKFTPTGQYSQPNHPLITTVQQLSLIIGTKYP